MSQYPNPGWPPQQPQGYGHPPQPGYGPPGGTPPYGAPPQRSGPNTALVVVIVVLVMAVIGGALYLFVLDSDDKGQLAAGATTTPRATSAPGATNTPVTPPSGPFVDRVVTIPASTLQTTIQLDLFTGDVVEILVSNISGPDPQITLLDPTGSFIDRNDDSRGTLDSRLQLTIGQTGGTHDLLIESVNGTAGDVRLIVNKS